ncbi:MAG: dihydrofolate reductase family protein [Ktedonobacterales bacterium]
MRVLLLAAISIDGRIARTGHEVINWSSPEDKRMFMQVSQEAGLLIMGRSTYETLERPLPDRLHIVLTHDPSRPAPPRVEFTSAPPALILEDLETRGFQTAILAGGARTYRTFIDAGLVDELWLTLEPVAFGGGISLLGDDADDPLDLRLRLIQSQLLNESSLQIRYHVSR